MENFNVLIEGRMCDDIPYHMKKPKYIGINVIINEKKVFDGVRIEDIGDRLIEIRNDYPNHVLRLLINSIGPVAEFMVAENEIMKEREKANGIQGT